MKIEVLYVPGCPHHALALRRLDQVLQAEAIAASIQEIAVTHETTAQSLGFRGSPTIRIEGIDIEPSENPSVGLACRLYSNGEGAPSAEMLRRAVLGAKQARSGS